jgi:hypothetical protein
MHPQNVRAARQGAAEDPFRLALRKNPKPSVWGPVSGTHAGIFTGQVPRDGLSRASPPT